MSWDGIDGWVGVGLTGLLVAIGGSVSSIFAQRMIPLVQQGPKYRLQQARVQSAELDPLDAIQGQLPTIDVMIPAYNEALNIETCVRSVLTSTTLPAHQLSIWVVDDQSTDRTWEILTALATECEQRGDDRLKILQGQDRPEGEVWMGKNWACTQAMDRATGDYVLFIDADVQLQPSAIETAVMAALEQKWDLLTGWPTIVCDCLGEWIAQPIVASMFALAFQPDRIIDPQDETMFAVGPFMLFRRTAYDRIGGHRALRSEIVEDVELARAIQQAGLSLHFSYLGDLAQLRMYRTFGALWEGWTKNWHLGSRRNTKATFYSALIALLVFFLPWFSAGLALLQWGQAYISGDVKGWILVPIALSSLVLLIRQYQIRQRLAQVMNLSARYWWLSGIGGLVIASIAVVSWIKTETGWGWTWRGRSLKLS